MLFGYISDNYYLRYFRKARPSVSKINIVKQEQNICEFIFFMNYKIGSSVIVVLFPISYVIPDVPIDFLIFRFIADYPVVKPGLPNRDTRSFSECINLFGC